VRQYAVIGLGSFGLRMLEKLAAVTDEIVVVDRDADAIEKCKDLAKNAYIADVANGEALAHVLPEGLDVAVVDVGDNIEAAILVTNTLKKLGVGEIIVKANSDQGGEILKIIGATRVVYPDREAATQIVPMLVSPALFNYMPLSPSLVMAEVKIPEKYAGLTLIEANLRQRHGINVIAIRTEGTQDYRYFAADYKLRDDDVLLVAGKEKEVLGISGGERKAGKRHGLEVFTDLLRGKKDKGEGR
jgi:trk system potassium uptake protein TrkA